MSISNDEVYVITPEVLSELKDCIAYADTLSCYKILSEIKPVKPVGYVYRDWLAPRAVPVYTIGEQP